MYTFILKDKEILLKADGSLPDSADMASFQKSGDCLYFKEDSTDMEVLELPAATEIPAQYQGIPFRDFYASRPQEEQFRAFRAKALCEWRRNSRYCGTCGTLLEDGPSPSVKECPRCACQVFPRISPCVIVLVHKDDTVLLARHTYRNQDIYACLAGFMEAGESAEQAVEREVFEETGIRIKNITYRGSQSWPFPDQLMLGFTADWESGEIVLQEEEIADAQWFRTDSCPASPKPGTIAYNLIHGLY